MTLQGYQPLDIDAIRSYVADLQSLLDESGEAQRKAFLRSFVKKIIVEKGKGAVILQAAGAPECKEDGYRSSSAY